MEEQTETPPGTSYHNSYTLILIMLCEESHANCQLVNNEKNNQFLSSMNALKEEVRDGDEDERVD